jgi:two-component system, NtrC family, nitrogen regulation response regulator GlnG
MTGKRILLADDDASIRLVLSQALAREGYQVRATGNASTLWKWVKEGEGDLVITDVVMPDENIFEILPRIRLERPKLPVIVMSAQNTLLTAVSAAEQGAYEYIPKPFDLDEFVEVVRRASAPSRDFEAAQKQRKAQKEERLPLIGRSAPMQEVYRTIARVMATDLTVLVQGESGTGKELVARALHDFGKRRAGPFVAMNMAAAAKEAIEAELFGSATEGSRPGRFEMAAGGTLFLDEVGDMPMEAQTRLLRVLQEGEYLPVGSATPRKADVRIVAATNRDLRSLIQQGLFREDLFFRLNVVPIRLPPLRERLDDIPDLARAFLLRAKREGLPEKVIDQGALDLLRTHAWPGNVRELENLMRRMAALYTEDVLTARLMERELRAESPRQTRGSSEDDADLEELAGRSLARLFAASPGGLPAPGLYDRILEKIERPLVSQALKATRGNQIKAAEILGLNRNTLRKKIRSLNIDAGRAGAD